MSPDQIVNSLLVVRGARRLARQCHALRRRPAVAATELDASIDAVVARYRLPGLAVGIVEDGEVVYQRTAGEADAEASAAGSMRTRCSRSPPTPRP